MSAAIVILVVALVLHAPHFALGRADLNFDFFIHYNWAKDFADSVAAGNWYPRWTFEARYGLGEPAFIFYSPVYYMLTAALAGAGLSVWASMHVVEVISAMVVGAVVFRLGRHYLNGPRALLLACVAMANPFVVMLNYKFNGFAWGSVGYAFHALLAYALLRPGAMDRVFNGLAIAAVAGAVYAHTISALVNLVAFSVVPLAAAYGRRHDGARVWMKPLVSWAMSAGLGLGLSAVYLYPALAYLDVINTKAWTGDHILQAFAFPTFTTRLYGGMQWFAFQWPVALPALLMSVALFAYGFRTRRSGHPLPEVAVLLIAASGCALFFATELSWPLWLVDSPLLKIQLPYRFVSVLFFVAAFGCLVVSKHAHESGSRGWARALLATVLLVALVSGLVLAKAALLDGRKLPEVLSAGDYSFAQNRKQFVATGTTDVCTTEDDDCKGRNWAAGTYRGVPEYGLKWSQPGYRDYARGGLAAECARRGAACEAAVRNVHGGLTWQVASEREIDLVLPSFDFPSWKLSVDDAPVTHRTDPATGLIEVRLPAGRHRIESHWQRSEREWRGVAIAGVFAVLTLVSWFAFRRRT